ncbi:hypothetical protein Tdes44962_MAKER03130 [Teratosphaeria destructans]|uniref:Uncharacterized protein n=1 Tax=Teratosphaeria destructans TaxID=418781 RepID=A0A9W7SRJ6_9PEZI|nr:hypothetical protein Tdes44962_MAKER03130 [Teratosphaeria destructans]
MDANTEPCMDANTEPCMDANTEPCMDASSEPIYSDNLDGRCHGGSNPQGFNLWLTIAVIEVGF